jgi:hypothetical protein
MEPVQTLGREYSMAILGATSEPKSATRLSESLDIPVATCYRRVAELVSVGLLEEWRAGGDAESSARRSRRTPDVVGIRFGPTPSVFAWACVRQAVGADASTLDSPEKDQALDPAGLTPVDVLDSDV